MDRCIHTDDNLSLWSPYQGKLGLGRGLSHSLPYRFHERVWPDHLRSHFRCLRYFITASTSELLVQILMMWREMLIEAEDLEAPSHT